MSAFTKSIQGPGLAGDGSDRAKSLACLFKQKRVECGFDLASLAEQAQISIDVAAQLESSPERVPLEDLYAVANVLNLDPGIVLELLHSAAR